MKLQQQGAVIDNYTSTGKKFWCWPEQMDAYRQGSPSTIISTHISPEGMCNLKCPYCSVARRTKHGRIPYEVVKKYVESLMPFGLKAVIITGGGEPLLYPDMDRLLMWLNVKGLKIGLITNGTVSGCLTAKAWGMLDWVRVSINLFEDWRYKINLPSEALSKNCVVGCSFVYTGEKQVTFYAVSSLADELGAKYIRLLPNCLLSRYKLEQMHKKLGRLTTQLRKEDKRYFHQKKQHRPPKSGVCHLSHFRPYLSEEAYWKNGKSGSVYPCDSVVLNNAVRKFKKKYQLCYATDAVKFLTGEMKPRFDPRKDCRGCVFTNTVEMLDAWKKKGNKINVNKEGLLHKEFV